MDVEAPQRLARALGESGGDGWLDRLPGIVEETVSRQSLDVERVVAPGGRSSLVLLVRLEDGTPAALKLAPAAARPEAERTALEHWDGRGAVRLLSSPGDALVLERLHPEVSLRSLPESRALLEAAGIVRRLWVEPPPGHGFETVAGRTARQAEAMQGTAEPLVSSALAAREELLAAPAEALLLHGSFRQGKVLGADRVPWLAVGPEPVVGERAYDLARLVRDRVEDLIASPSGASATRRRVNRLADSLELDPDRLRAWTLFRAVESATRGLRAGRVREAEVALEFASWL
ncbi:aminoglycoside phosphotransferase family protein [Streptomyces sp. NPDC051018]|uniref:aminoglycoside phosphotransferase family protein n=1 Tax=Streptomyces sp. NPDC051018 TaxID=3365639 RepID=UPI0037950F0B